MNIRNSNIFLAVLLILSALVTYFYFGGSFTGLLITGKPIKIGVVLTTNDHYTQIIDDEIIKNSMQMVLDNVNFFGINSSMVRMEYENDWNNANAAKIAMENLINDGARIIVIISWDTFLELAPSAEEEGIILFLPTVSGFEYDTGNHTFRNMDYVFVPTLTLADVAYKNLDITEVLILHSEYPDDRRGTLIKNIFKWRFEDLGGVVTQEMDFDTSENFNEQISEIKNIKPETILIAGIGRAIPEIVSIINKIREQNINSTILLPVDISMLSTELDTRNVIFVASHIYMEEGIDNLFTNYRLKYGAPTKKYISSFLASIHESADIIIQVMKVCNGDDMECIKRELHESKFNTINGEVRFSENGIMIREYQIKAIENRKSVDLYTYSLVDSDISKYSELLRNVKGVYG